MQLGRTTVGTNKNKYVWFFWSIATAAFNLGPQTSEYISPSWTDFKRAYFSKTSEYRWNEHIFYANIFFQPMTWCLFVWLNFLSQFMSDELNSNKCGDVRSYYEISQLCRVQDANFMWLCDHIDCFRELRGRFWIPWLRLRKINPQQRTQIPAQESAYNPNASFSEFTR